MTTEQAEAIVAALNAATDPARPQPEQSIRIRTSSHTAVVWYSHVNGTWRVTP